MPLLPLELLQPGELATISELTGEPAAVHRLEELGLRRGAEIQMVAPGRPCLIAIGHQRLSLRLAQGVDVLVELLPTLAGAR